MTTSERIWRVVETMSSDAPMAKVTHAVAVAGVTTPVWLSSLEELSRMAALWTPILGAVWLITQIVRAWRGKK